MASCRWSEIEYLRCLGAFGGGGESDAPVAGRTHAELRENEPGSVGGMLTQPIGCLQRCGDGGAV